MTDYHKIQAIMDSAYTGFTDTMSLKDFYASLDPKTLSVVAFGNLNYQVENGGFLQWHDNGYSIGHTSILEGLARLATPEAQEMIKLLQKARDRLLDLAKQDREEEDDFEDALEYGKLNAMDTAFYALAPKVLEQFEASLNDSP